MRDRLKKLNREWIGFSFSLVANLASIRNHQTILSEQETDTHLKILKRLVTFFILHALFLSLSFSKRYKI